MIVPLCLYYEKIVAKSDFKNLRRFSFHIYILIPVYWGSVADVENAADTAISIQIREYYQYLIIKKFPHVDVGMLHETKKVISL